jgi:hypothetical protein
LKKNTTGNEDREVLVMKTGFQQNHLNVSKGISKEALSYWTIGVNRKFLIAEVLYEKDRIILFHGRAVGMPVCRGYNR